MTELECGGVFTSPPLPSQTKPKLPPGCGHQRPLCRDRGVEGQGWPLLTWQEAAKETEGRAPHPVRGGNPVATAPGHTLSVRHPTAHVTQPWRELPV